MTCAWLLGVRRTRILVTAICSSTGRRRATTRASFSGVAPRGEADDLRARRAGVDDQAGERDVVERVRLLGHRRVEAARGDEGVDEVEVGGRRAVELGDAAVRVERDGGLGIVRRGERDEPRLVVPLARSRRD